MLKDLLCFRTMLTPILIQWMFWLSIVVTLVAFVINLSQHHFWIALQVIILGPLCARVIAELLLVTFRIYQSLHNIEQNTRR